MDKERIKIEDVKTPADAHAVGQDMRADGATREEVMCEIAQLYPGHTDLLDAALAGYDE